ncbi:hypothetical protein [Reinekea thalattae]|uniref:Uncharacterized protein n=1 Tax=Reinekea thalattae TaxID=2593301 RepID=A0A5C8Z7W3_9GAMM|nr:hypothetical protein [Reinekea thalattae]TXR54042.1 hypothetical protein FME95_05745 [Reinekea thalattae]
MPELIDFTEFEPFNELREKMAATKLGSFEMFDPEHHLTGEERSQLELQGMQVDRHQLMQLLDFTLVYKNSRVIILDIDEYHIAACQRSKQLEKLSITTRLAEKNNNMHVCKACLQTLQFQGYDDQKARKEHYSEDIYRKFNLAQFWTGYQQYPVAVFKEVRKPLA